MMAAKQTEKPVKIRDSALFASRSLGLQLGVIKSFVGGLEGCLCHSSHWVCEKSIVLC